MKIRYATLLGTLLVSACASASVTPPADANIAKAQELPLPFETAWSRTVDWFANNNITIDKIEKSSGLITAKYSLAVDKNLLDCGNIKFAGIVGEPQIERLGSFNVTVRSDEPSTSRVTANFFGEFRAVALDAWDGRPVVLEGRCNSTGAIEREFLISLAGPAKINLAPAKLPVATKAKPAAPPHLTISTSAPPSGTSVPASNASIAYEQCATSRLAGVLNMQKAPDDIALDAVLECSAERNAYEDALRQSSNPAAASVQVSLFNNDLIKRLSLQALNQQQAIAQ